MNEGATQFSPRTACNVVRNQIAEIECDVSSIDAQLFPMSMFRNSTSLHLAQARGWLGKCLGVLGGAYPYPRSMDPTSPEIESPAYAKLPIREEKSEPVSSIKKARADIQRLLDVNDKWIFAPHPEGFDRYFALFKTSLESAKMTLGEELGILGGY